GNPTKGGVYNFVAKVTDSANTSVTQAFSVSIVTPLSITTTSVAAGQVSYSYAQALAASGGTSPYSWMISSGALPGGVSLKADGTLSGIPTAGGSFSFTAQVTDHNNTSATKDLTLT